MSTVRIAPSILNCDFCELGAAVDRLAQAGADILHLDVMDGHFVPNLSFGVPVAESVGKRTQLLMEAHLMISDPGKYAPRFIEAGCRRIIYHAEVVEHPRQLIDQIRALGAEVGVAINPGTPAEAILDVITAVDEVLVMTVWPGFGGQQFIHDCLDKVRTLRSQVSADFLIEVDGGINRDSAALAAAAGANVLVAGSAIVHTSDWSRSLQEIRASAEGAIKRGL